MKPALFLLLAVLAAVTATFTSCADDSEDSANVVELVAPEGDLNFAYVDVAAETGYTMRNRSGTDTEKEYILEAMPPGIAVADFNGDGWYDLYCPNGNKIVSYDQPSHTIRLNTDSSRPRNELYLNRKGKRFEAVGKAAGVDDPGWAFGAIAGDVDNDGDPDLFVCNWGANLLYLNDGTGKFKEVGVSAGVAGDPRHWSLGPCFVDIDNDGDLDLYVAQYADMDAMLRNPKITQLVDGKYTGRTCVWRRLEVYCGPTGLRPLNDVVFKNMLVETGELKFEDVTKKAGCWLKYDPKRSETTESPGPYYGFQPVAFDINQDGWQDIFVANDTQENLCWINQKDGTFKNDALVRGLARSMDDFTTQASMGVAVADFNQDGMLDITITEFSHDQFNLLLGEKLPAGMIVFKDVAARTSVRDATFTALGWGALFVDPDLDGDVDIFYACGHVFPEVMQKEKVLDTTYKQPNLLLLNEDPKNLRLRLLGATAGPGLAIEKCSRGAVMIDFDNDGDPDIATTELNDMPCLLRCDNASGNRWLSIRLVGNPQKKVPLDPAGTVVTVKTGDRAQKKVFLIGSSFLSSEDPRLLFGMGDAEAFDSIEVLWTNGEKTEIPGSHTNQALIVRLK